MKLILSLHALVLVSVQADIYDAIGSTELTAGYGADYELVGMLSNYGCYCSQVFGKLEVFQANAAPLDLTDKACYDLMKCLRCSDPSSSDVKVLNGTVKFRSTLTFDPSNDLQLMEQCGRDNPDPSSKSQCICHTKFIAAISGKDLLTL